MMEELRSPETSVLTTATRRSIPEDDILLTQNVYIVRVLVFLYPGSINNFCFNPFIVEQYKKGTVLRKAACCNTRHFHRPDNSKASIGM
jgi:hypothetical protein